MMPDWFGILLTILSIFIGGFALGVKYGESKNEHEERRIIVGTPYLRAIELLIQDAFPKSKVYVFCEESPFSPTKYAVKAYVDRYGAYVTLDAFEGVNERYISEKLISMIKGEMERSEDE